jgi:hypothetical protein
MTFEDLIKEAKEIVAKGCSCDRACEDPAFQADFYCGCASDARQIVELTQKFIGGDTGKTGQGPEYQGPL